MGIQEKEEILGLLVLLAVIITLSLLNKLTPTALDGIKYIGMAYLASLGVQGVLPKK